MINVESKLIPLRGQMVLLDRDLAELYGVETRVINQAVKNNPDKFPQGYIYTIGRQEVADLKSKFSTSSEVPDKEVSILRSKILTLESQEGKGHYSKYAYKAFTEKGLYMLATILKSPQATQATLSIIETYAQVREMARTMEALQNVVDGGSQQQTLLQKVGEMLGNVVGANLSTESTETEIEFNFAVVKIKHKIIKK